MGEKPINEGATRGGVKEIKGGIVKPETGTARPSTPPPAPRPKD